MVQGQFQLHMGWLENQVRIKKMSTTTTVRKQYPNNSTLEVTFESGLFTVINEPRGFYRDDNAEKQEETWLRDRHYPELILIPTNGSFIRDNSASCEYVVTTTYKDSDKEPSVITDNFSSGFYGGSIPVFGVTGTATSEDDKDRFSMHPLTASQMLKNVYAIWDAKGWLHKEPSTYDNSH